MWKADVASGCIASTRNYFIEQIDIDDDYFICVCINIYLVCSIIKHLQYVWVQSLYIFFVCLWVTSLPTRAWQVATSSGEMWVILPTLLAPLFIPSAPITPFSAPRVWLLFHQWRRHTAVIALLLLPVISFALLCFCMQAATGWF